jgi:hypothetical protein
MLSWVGAQTGVSQEPGAKSKAEDVQSKIAGVWRGHSECTDKNSPCHNEVNVYRFAKIEGRPNSFTVTASKIVDGKEIVMGSGEWRYDEKKSTVECEKPSIQLKVEGGKMEGALKLDEGTVYRRIFLKKES